MRLAFLLLPLLYLAGCTTLDLSRSAKVLAAPPDTVVEARFLVPLPVATAYRNTVDKARECWQQSTGLLFTQTSSLELDPFDPVVGEARIAVRMERLVQAVVTFKPSGPAATDVLARVPKLGGTAHFFTQADVPFIGAWAAGTPAQCQFRFIL